MGEAQLKQRVGGGDIKGKGERFGQRGSWV